MDAHDDNILPDGVEKLIGNPLSFVQAKIRNLRKGKSLQKIKAAASKLHM